MTLKDIENTAGEVLSKDSKRANEKGKYHPSTISSCGLKVVLSRITDTEDKLNSWLFQGSAVHYYLQETGLMDQILYQAGYHPIDTSYEVHRLYSINDEVTITGRCDILTSNGEESAVIDIKYTSLKPEYNHGRLMKYFSQVNVYANMFGVEEFGLFMINSKTDDLVGDGINMLTGDRDDENWEMMKEKAVNIHDTLEYLDWEPEDTIVSVSDLVADNTEFWEEMLQFVEVDRLPAYDEECNYCDFADECPIYQGTIGGGLRGAMNGIKD